MERVLCDIPHRKSRKEPKDRFGSGADLAKRFPKAPLRFHLPVCPYVRLILL